MNIKYFTNAMLLIEGKNTKVLSDPWITFNNNSNSNYYNFPENKFTQKQKRVKQSAKRTERAERADDDVSIRIEGDVFEVGSMLNDKPLVLISKKETCKDDNYDIKLIEASGVFGTFNSYKKDLDNMDDILKSKKYQKLVFVIRLIIHKRFL